MSGNATLVIMFNGDVYKEIRTSYIPGIGDNVRLNSGYFKVLGRLFDFTDTFNTKAAIKVERILFQDL